MKYFSAQLKRVLRYLPFAVVMSLLLVTIFSLFALRFIDDDSASEDKQIIKIGMVGDTSSTFLGVGIELIKEADSSNMMLSLETMSESNARAMLNAGKISAYIVVPEGFVDAATHGDVMQLDFVTSDVSGGITAVFKEEILTAISQMLVHSQKGIYAMQDLVLSNGLREDYGKNTDELFLRYFNLIFKRPSVLRLDVLGISDGVDLVTYLLCGLSIFCLSLFGIQYCPLYVRTDHSLGRLAASRGFSVWKQTVYELLAYLFAVLVTCVCVFSVLPMIGAVSFGSALRFFAFSIPAVVLVAVLQFFAFTVADNVAGGATFQFFGAVILSYVCGCIYPISFFPEALQLIGNVLPLGVIRKYIVSVVCGTFDVSSAVTIAIYSVFLIIAAIAVNYRKTLSAR